MELSVQDQILDQIKKANRILIALPQNLTADSVASGLALKLFLEKLKKEVEVAASGAIVHGLKFLPGSEAIKNALPTGKSLVVILDTSVKQLEELSYETTETKASIFLKAKEGQFGPEDISFTKEKAPFDLIFCVDTPSLGSLGELFEKNTDVFYEGAKINIDHKPENELFGAINLVDLSSTSSGEILAGLFEKFEDNLIDEDIATCLLTGIVSKTDSFQHAKTTPRAFLSASKLITLGGRQQDIVKALYKTKPLNLLRLWGRTLARLRDESGSAVYAVLNAQDFEKSKSSVEDLPKVLSDLLANISGKRILGIIAERPDNSSEIYLAAQEPLNTEKIQANLGVPEATSLLSPYNFRLLHFVLPAINLVEAEAKFLEAVKE